MSDQVTEFHRDDSGATAIEYSLLAAMAAAGALVLLESHGVSMQKLFNWAAITLGILLLAGALAFAVFRYAGKTETNCRWRRHAAIDNPPFRGWVCRHCGEEMHTRRRWARKECRSEA